MKRLLLIAALLLPLSAQAQAEWSQRSLLMLSVAEAALLIDYKQTSAFTQERRPDGSYRWHERNLLLGEHPSAGRVNTHFALALLVVPLIAHQMNERDRHLFLSVFATLELFNVGRNYGLGVHFVW